MNKVESFCLAMWRQASLPAVEGGILPPGKTVHLSQRSHFTMTFPVTRGSAGRKAPALRSPVFGLKFQLSAFKISTFDRLISVFSFSVFQRVSILAFRFLCP
jgi:hypothetical protein